MTPIQRLYALRDELLDLTKGRTADGKPTHIPPPKSANGQAKARAAGYSPVPGGKTWAHASVRRRGEGSQRRAAPRSSGGGDLLKTTTPLMLLRDHGPEKMADMLVKFPKADLVRYARREGIPLPGRLTGPKGTAEAVVVALVEAAQFQKDDLAADRRDEIDAKQREWSASLATRHKSAEHAERAMVEATASLRRELSDDQMANLVHALGMRTEMLDEGEVATDGGHDGHLAAADALFDVLREQARTNPTFARALASVLSRTVYLPPPDKKMSAAHLVHLDPFTMATQGEEAFRAKFGRLTDPQKRQVLTAFNLATRDDVSSRRGDALVDLLWDATSTKRARMERRS